MALSIGFRIFSLLPSCYSSYGALNFYPGGTFTHCSCQPSLDAHLPGLMLPKRRSRRLSPTIQEPLNQLHVRAVWGPTPFSAGFSDTASDDSSSSGSKAIHLMRETLVRVLGGVRVLRFKVILAGIASLAVWTTCMNPDCRREMTGKH
jgi:hypothetical protein